MRNWLWFGKGQTDVVSSSRKIGSAASLPCLPRFPERFSIPWGTLSRLFSPVFAGDPPPLPPPPSPAGKPRPRPRNAPVPVPGRATGRVSIPPPEALANSGHRRRLPPSPAFQPGPFSSSCLLPGCRFRANRESICRKGNVAALGSGKTKLTPFSRALPQFAEAAMAAGGPLEELCEEASCSICLDYFRDPVSIAECGHNFCRACLTRTWGEPGAAEPACPQCRGRAQPKRLRPNQQLANFVEIAKKLRPVEGKGAEAKGVEAKGAVCEKHGEPLKFLCRKDEAPLCVVCRRSQEHRGHQVAPLEEEEEAAGEKKIVMAARKESICQKHQEPLKLFCRDHEAPICVVCEQSQEHQYHDIVPVEEASQEYKDQFCSCVEILQKEKNRILAYKVSLVKKSQDLLRQTKGEQQKMLTQFRQLHMFLDKQEKLLLAQMEEVEKEVARNRDQHLTELSEELSSLEGLIREMEEKSQQPAGDLLQDARSTLQRYKEKESFENPVAFPLALKWRIWNFSDLSPLLEAIKKQFKDTLNSGLHLQKASVTLDPDTAHPELILSERQKHMRREKSQALPNNPERFDQSGAVLGLEGFTGGRHFWEVLVGSEKEWAVGVARKSVSRKGELCLHPEKGIWAVRKLPAGYIAARKGSLPLILTGELKRIRVWLNYTGGRVAFFDADRAALLYEFSGASFPGETLLPFFWVPSKGHLRISS